MDSKMKKLSLVAHYDDLIRLGESLIDGDQFEDKIRQLLESCDKQCKLLILERQELNESREVIRKLKKDNQRLETTLKNVREAFRNEVNLKTKLKQERDALVSKLTVIQNFLLEDFKENNTDMKEKILSSLNLNGKSQALIDSPLSDDDLEDSLSDIDFDKTEDDLLSTTAVRNLRLHSTQNRLSTSALNLEKEFAKDLENDRRLSKEFGRDIRKRKSSLIDQIAFPSSPKKAQQQQQQQLQKQQPLQEEDRDLIESCIADKPHIETTNSYDELEELEKLDRFDEKKFSSQFKSAPSIVNQVMNASLTNSIIKQRLSMLPTTFENSSGLNDFKINNRPHQFVTKKIYRPEKCGPCGLSIGFCTSSYRCRDCRAICHISCKDLVPLPCIPYVSRANIGKQGKLVLISDFTPQNIRPCVPALIIHCCTEIEKRGLNEIGPYRISGSKSCVTEYKERILDSKKGMPNLSTVDIYVLCGVVKEFLNSLDESLITKLAWRDFVTGSAIKDEEQRTAYLNDLILNLHVSNRDTLAYFILHLQKIIASPECKMPITNLSRIFGPTIVGFSMKDPPAKQMHEENAKQIAVMEALLSLDGSFWENLISRKSTVPLIRKDSLNEVIGNLNRGSSSAGTKVQDGYSNYSNSRMSIGSRLCGGRVASGTLTPLKSSNIRSHSSKTTFVKPLF